MVDSHSPDSSSQNPSIKRRNTLNLRERIRRILFGAPKNLNDRGLYQSLSLLPFLAWVGLGADPLSSSAYGPEEAFITLGSHTYLAIVLAIITAGTVFLIAAVYSHIIEEFPHGGGGYVVATKLLGERPGIISGCALLVDYVLTIAVSVASAGDALFSFLPHEWLPYKLSIDIFLIIALIVLNIRGVRESVFVLLPMFLLFLVSHLLAIGGGIIAHANRVPELTQEISTGFSTGIQTLGISGLLLLLVHAYSMGGGTYTGLEAVSNGLPIIREPRVRNAKRTMIYMASSLAITAGGLILCYLLWNISYIPGKTMNASLLSTMTSGLPGAGIFVILTLISEGALLIVAAQAGFIDGPRVLANMAVDYWIPRRFAALSDRLTTRNGILLMGMSALAILIYARGNVRHLVVMYSINVFLTFSLSMLGMLRHSVKTRLKRKKWRRRSTLFLIGFLLCSSILFITITQKFMEGGWMTLSITVVVLALVFRIRSHYRAVSRKVAQLYSELENVAPEPQPDPGPVDPEKPAAAILVGGYQGLGIHTTLNIERTFPGQFKNFIFISVGIIDSGTFKGESSFADLRERTETSLKKFVDLGRRLGIASQYRMAMGMDMVEEAEKLCDEIAREFPHVTFFAGKIMFKREKWYQRLLHNEHAMALQNRLLWSGKTMVIMPAQIN